MYFLYGVRMVLRYISEDTKFLIIKRDSAAEVV